MAATTQDMANHSPSKHPRAACSGADAPVAPEPLQAEDTLEAIRQELAGLI
jgi:hypothetical protein